MSECASKDVLSKSEPPLGRDTIALIMPGDSETHDLTAVLAAAAQGDIAARDQFVEAVYQQLHRLAAHVLSAERPGLTFQTTALVNEALLRLFGGSALSAMGRKHFFNVAARQMRRILIDRARSHNAEKRLAEKVSLDDAPPVAVRRSAELIAVDDALNELEKIDPAAANVVDLKYFGGFTDQESAAFLDVSLSQFRRDWEYARAWLHDRLSQR